MRKRRHRARKRRGKLSLAQVERGIYIDFEGLTGKHPILLGAMNAPATELDEVQQCVVDPTFEGAADGAGIPIAKLEDLADRLVSQAVTEGRYLIAWSEHDLNVVRDYCSHETASRFAARYRNARAYCERWLELLHPDVNVDEPGREGHALSTYMDLVGYEVPAQFGPGRTGENLRRLTAPLGAGKARFDLTDRQRGYWSEVIGHNKHDCLGMYVVCRQAASEIGDEGQGSGQDPSRRAGGATPSGRSVRQTSTA
jgi:hypothetical protein